MTLNTSRLILWDRMLDNTQDMLFSAATNKDPKDVFRMMSTFLDASYRDVIENAEAVSRIWRRYSRHAVVRIATTPASPNPFMVAGR